MTAEEQLEDAPQERLGATLKELKGKSASLAIPQSMRAAVERRADQVRQRLRELDPMSLPMPKVQSAIGRAEEQLRKKTVAAEQAERDRQQAQQRRDQLVEDMRVLSDEMANQRGVAWVDPMDQGEDYEDGDGWCWWHGNSSTGDYWDHQEP